jgi:hypothetical protein
MNQKRIIPTALLGFIVLVESIQLILDKRYFWHGIIIVPFCFVIVSLVRDFRRKSN